MVRVQVQLTNQQLEMLKPLAVEEGISIAELIRRSVDLYLCDRQFHDREALKESALSVVGKYTSGQDDVGANHDRCLAEIYAGVAP